MAEKNIVKQEFALRSEEKRRQRVVIEFSRGDWLVMLDTGDVHVVGTPVQALRLAKAAAEKGNPGITVTTIEWRNAPDGFVPPTNTKEAARG